MEHRQTFSTGKRAGCSCGFVAVNNGREGARRQLIRHIINPQAPGKIADAPYEHKRCRVENWSVKWGVCTEHNVYRPGSRGSGPGPNRATLNLRRQLRKCFT